jgi:hypothetical protein
MCTGVLWTRGRLSKPRKLVRGNGKRLKSLDRSSAEPWEGGTISEILLELPGDLLRRLYS